MSLSIQAIVDNRSREFIIIKVDVEIGTSFSSSFRVLKSLIFKIKTEH